MSPAEYTRSPELLNLATSRLLVVDMQQRFASVIPQFESVAAICRRLIQAAQVLGVPVSVTEQYPLGLGPTISSLAELVGERHEKLRFSCAEALPWASSGGSADGRHQIVLAGIEAHVCMLQTAMDLLSAGFDVYVAVDATSSRHEVDREIALKRMADNGVRLITSEMALFEWCEVAGTDQFKAISRLVTGK